MHEWVYSDIGSFLEGDGSPLSYFQASILIRELREIGALWHGCSWSTHEVLTTDKQIPEQAWKWQVEHPQDWRPKVERNSDGLPQVIFYSYTGFEQEQILVHCDTYIEGYRFNTVVKPIALGEGGYIF